MKKFFKGHLNIVEPLIKKGADLNAITHDGVTPLSLATAGNHHAIIA